MSRHTVVTLACAAFIFLFFWKGCFKAAILRIRNPSMLGREAPTLRSTKLVLREDVKERPALPTPNVDWTLYVFFESDSGSCIDDVAVLNRLYDDYGGKGLVVFGLSTEPEETIEAFAKKHDARYPLIAEAAADQEAFRVKMIWGSVAFLVDSNKKVVEERLDRIVRFLDEEFES